MIARFWSGATRRGALLVGGGPAEALYWSGATRRGALYAQWWAVNAGQ